MLQTILNSQTRPIWPYPAKPDPVMRHYSTQSFWPRDADFVVAGTVGRDEPFAESQLHVLDRTLVVPNVVLPTITDAQDTTTARYTSVVYQGKTKRLVWMQNYVLTHTAGAVTDWVDVAIFNRAYIPFIDSLTLNRQQIIDLIESYYATTTVRAHGRALMVDGIANVPAAFITDDSNIFPAAQEGGVSGSLRIDNRVAGAGFDILSSNLFDTGFVGWMVLEQA